MVVSVVNTCPTSATYTLLIKTAANGSNLFSTGGSIPADRGVTVIFRSASVARSLVVAQVSINCPTAEPDPLVGVVLANAANGIPIVAVDVLDNPGL
jgi:hypothetical protein